MRWLSALGLAVVALLMLGVVATPLSAVASAQTTNGTGAADDESAFNDSQWVVTVYENGSARWTQHYNQRLANESEVERFRAYGDRFTAEETPLYTDFRQTATALTSEGTNATGREMSARAFSRQSQITSQPESTGVVEMSFFWTNFSATTDGDLTVGDAIGGFYLSSGMSLEIKSGPNLEIAWQQVEPSPDASTNGSTGENDSVTWFGDRQFASGQPQVVFVESSGMGMNGPSPFDGSVVWLAAALAVAVVFGAVVVRRSERSPFGRSVAATADERNVENTPEDLTDADEPADTPDESTAAAVAEPTVPDEELRSDEEVVRSLLDENDGRMHQSEIVSETGWSKSKVSMLLSEMADDGDISKLRVGRENIVSLDGHEPEAAGSPFDEE
ncbi:helix-turn-helix transcriptional regulator [Halococcus saccharolyticus]|uniref:HTH iclR-type domain-containing protein n=1 Tax=Halococcus saccharolyticus DSM 5350 TaxID=1227455 RepID=M0MBF8_9EURY|nr:hypothetical protein [Halococcus saccharolyticus]EMA43107.1 hypothetical protein C449_14052 [Halococcus saccharolyticus DSM 5350]